METNNRSARAEPLRRGPTFQDGRHSDDARTPLSRRLSRKDRPQGCLSIGLHPSRVSTFSQISLERAAVPVLQSTIWPQRGSICLHETASSSDGRPQGARNSTGYLSRRHSGDGRFSTRGSTAPREYQTTPRRTWFHHQHGEKRFSPYPVVRIPRADSGHNSDENHPTGKEKEKDHRRVPNRPASWTFYSLGVSQGNRSFERDGECRSASSTLHQSIAESQTPDATTGLREVQHNADSIAPSSTGGIGMVDPKPAVLEWSVCPSAACRFNHCNRCQSDRLGRGLRRSTDRWSLEPTGSKATYQCVGAPSSLSGSSGVRQTLALDPASDGQHLSHSVREQAGRNALGRPAEYRQGSVGMVSSSQDYLTRSPPSWYSEHSGRLRVPACDRSPRLTAGSRDLPGHPELVRRNRCRPVCHSPDSASPSLLQLATRPRRHSTGCVPTAVGGFPVPIRVSTVQPNHASPSEVLLGTGYEASTGSSLVAQSAMVSNSPEHGNPGTSDATVTSPVVDQAVRQGTTVSSTVSNRPVDLSRLDCLRQAYREAGYSTPVINLLLQSWRQATERSYSSAWGKWSKWCTVRRVNPLQASLGDILRFLADSFQEGLQYHTINTYRSAISMTHDSIDGCLIGQHPTVSRMMKGIFQSRPPLPRYQVTWPVATVTAYLRQQRGNKELTLPLLTKSLAMLLALSTAGRSSDLHAFNVDFLVSQPQGIIATITGLTKTRRVGSVAKSLTIPRLKEGQLDPVSCLEEYQERTARWRSNDHPKSKQLFLALPAPHQPVTSSTIARWLKDVLSASGIDKGMFGAHSTRSASASAARAAGVSIDTIMGTADWRQETTFRQFYDRQVRNDDFANAVLA